MTARPTRTSRLLALGSLAVTGALHGPASATEPPPPPSATPQCSNGMDDDRDGAVDAQDPGCTGHLDDTESSDGGPPPPPVPTSPTDRVQCLAGGHAGFDVVFRNQGQCVRFVVTAGQGPR